jgi:hypothetical protein
MVHELTQGPHRARVEAASAWTLQIQAGLPIAKTRQIAPLEERSTAYSKLPD